MNHQNFQHTESMNLNSPRKNPYSSVEQAKRNLANKGYETSFSLSSNGKFLEDGNGNKYSADDLSINHVERFTAKENESEKSTLYAVSAKDGRKGVVEDGFGKSISDELNTFMQQVDSHDASSIN